MPTRSSAWITARLDVTPAGLVLELADHRDARPKGVTLERIEWPLSPDTSQHVLVPANWRDFVEYTLDRHRQSLPANHPGATTLPIFLQPAPGTEALDWEYGLGLLAGMYAQPVRQAPSAKLHRSPFDLPIDVLAVDDAAQEMAETEASWWYTQVPAVREHGLVVRSSALTSLRTALASRSYDIVLARAADWQRVQTAVNAVPLNDEASVTRPRLIILLAETSEPHLLPRHFSAPPGTALLVVNRPPMLSAADFLKDFFYGIFHDQPLHGALHSTTAVPRKGPAPHAWLFANPDTNQNIRISDALRRLETLRDHLRYDVTAGDVEAFIARAGQDTLPWEHIARRLRDAEEASESVRQALDRSDRMQVNFSKETLGLVPMAESLAELRRARENQKGLRRDLAAIVWQPEAAEAIAQAQRRHVDVALESYDAAIASYLRIDKQVPLLPYTQYRLRLHIGHRGADSLVVGEPPPLDPLLPELKPGQPGHDLEVAIFEKDFKLFSERVVPLHLPALGGSRPVYFELRTFGEHRAAQLRINIYHRNHLLQAFLLTAEVRHDGYWQPTPAVGVELDVSTTEAFGNLSEITPRALAIGVNLDDDGATHRVMIKKDNHAAHPLKISDDIVKEQLKRFRALLKTYTSDSQQQPYFPTHPAAGAEPSPQFDQAVRALAQLGSDISLGIFQDIEEEIHDDLDQIRKAEDLTIQITRHRGNAVFPWPVLYDYVVPSPMYKDSAPVCRGMPLPDAPLASAQDGLGKFRGCPHNPGREVYCVHGFWGFRHRIEQVTTGGGAADAAAKIDTSAAAHTVCLASGLTQRACADLSNALQVTLGAKFVQFPPPSSPGITFGDYMWTAGSRPAVLVLLSHLSNPGGGAAQIVLVPPPPVGAPVILTANDVSQLTRLMRVWKDQPRTLVLLMACDSGATDVATLNDFVMAFKAAGAAAIVGTEAPVYLSLAARFAQDLLAALLAAPPTEPMPLGQAVRSVANQLLKEGNPLGLIFNFCGSADLIFTAATP